MTLFGNPPGALDVAPASPWQNGYAESLHSKLRDELLDREEFENPPQAQAMGWLWKEKFNTRSPHSSLDYKTPAEYASTCKRYVPIEETPSKRPLMNKRTGDSHDPWTKKWGACHRSGHRRRGFSLPGSLGRGTRNSGSRSETGRPQLGLVGVILGRDAELRPIREITERA